MKNLLLIALLLSYSHFINCQTIDDSYVEFTLTSDAPSHLPERITSLNNVKFATIDTGIDSLILTFGTYPKDGLKMCFAYLKN